MSRMAIRMTRVIRGQLLPDETRGTFGWSDNLFASAIAICFRVRQKPRKVSGGVAPTSVWHSLAILHFLENDSLDS